MYSKTENRVTFFEGSLLKNTDKVIFGRISESIKNGDTWENEIWNARFVGKSYVKARDLKSKDRIVLTEWCVHNHYDKKTKRFYPHIVVFDFKMVKTEESEG